MIYVDEQEPVGGQSFANSLLKMTPDANSLFLFVLDGGQFNGQLVEVADDENTLQLVEVCQSGIGGLGLSK